MIIKSITIIEGFSKRNINFSEKANLIHSKTNSCGKTTLLRCILYGLGYNIPGTKKFKFNQCIIKLLIECENIGLIELERFNKHTLDVTFKNEKKTYSLPIEENLLHQKIYQTETSSILENILGTFYIDQEKGWTLLNRGKIIGNIRFNIEELLCGLSGKDYSSLKKLADKLENDLKKYKSIKRITEYKETLNNTINNEVISYDDKLSTEILQLQIEERRLRKELHRIKDILFENKKFKQYIVDMKLLIEAPNKEIIPVTENNIYGLNDNLDLLSTKKKLLTYKINQINTKRKKLENERNTRDENLLFNNNNTSQIEEFDKKIASIIINPILIEKKISDLEKKLKQIKQKFEDISKTDNNDICKMMFNTLKKYLIELELGDEDSIHLNYLFTKDLKSLSGAVLHKTAFAFRLAYISTIEKALKIKLPFIIDSPSGKEVDKRNIELMMNILKRDFSDHQIIMASIFEYNFEDINIIEIQNQLMYTL